MKNALVTMAIIGIAAVPVQAKPGGKEAQACVAPVTAAKTSGSGGQSIIVDEAAMHRKAQQTATGIAIDEDGVHRSAKDKPAGSAPEIAITESGVKAADAAPEARIAVNESGVKACPASAVINTSRSNVKQ